MTELPDFPEVAIGCVSNLWSKMMHFKKANDTEFGHTHTFDHMTLLARGRLSVTVDGVASEFSAPQMIYIKAGKEHELTALEDDSLAYCIHALRDNAGDILDPSIIPSNISPQNVFETAAPLITSNL
jgi:hypothetical protein